MSAGTWKSAIQRSSAGSMMWGLSLVVVVAGPLLPGRMSMRASKQSAYRVGESEGISSMTNRCTFRDLFKDYLEMAIGQGGDVETVMSWVNAYQDGYPSVRWSVFGEWLGNEIFRCEKCGHEFKANGEETENEEVLCRPCSGWERGYDAARGATR